MTDTTITTEEFVKTINDLRKATKSWYTWAGIVGGREVYIKGYKTWLQIFRVGALTVSSPMDIPVKEFLKNLKEGVEV